MKKYLALIAFFFAFFSALPATANEEVYAKPSFGNFLKTMIRFGAVKIDDDDFLDGFAQVVECELYKKYGADEFTWRKARPVVRESIKANIGKYPTGFYYDAILKLGKYDFKTQKYMFDGEKAVKNFNTFSISVGAYNYCGESHIKLFPEEFKLIMDRPFQPDGIPLSEADAKLLLEHMEKNLNKKRLVFARFNMRVSFVALFTRYPVPGGAQGEMGPFSQGGDARFARFDMKLSSADFYEDEERTKLIYSYRP